MDDNVSFKYRAFLSYSHRDTRWAKWLHGALEGFRVDKDLVGRHTPLGPMPNTLRPIFRDRDDFSGGHSLTDATIAALDASAALVVLCSPIAAQRPAVNEEVRLFRSRHPDRPVIPVMIDGEPPDNVPPALRFELDADGNVSDRPVTLLGPDLRQAADGKNMGLAKIIAGLTGLSVDDVYHRAERARRRQNRLRAAIGVVLLALAVAGAGAYWKRLKDNVLEREVLSIVDGLDGRSTMPSAALKLWASSAPVRSRVVETLLNSPTHLSYDPNEAEKHAIWPPAVVSLDPLAATQLAVRLSSRLQSEQDSHVREGLLKALMAIAHVIPNDAVLPVAAEMQVRFRGQTVNLKKLEVLRTIATLSSRLPSAVAEQTVRDARSYFESLNEKLFAEERAALLVLFPELAPSNAVDYAKLFSSLRAHVEHIGSYDRDLESYRRRVFTQDLTKLSTRLSSEAAAVEADALLDSIIGALGKTSDRAYYEFQEVAENWLELLAAVVTHLTSESAVKFSSGFYYRLVQPGFSTDFRIVDRQIRVLEVLATRLDPKTLTKWASEALKSLLRPGAGSSTSEKHLKVLAALAPHLPPRDAAALAKQLRLILHRPEIAGFVFDAAKAPAKESWPRRLIARALAASLSAEAVAEEGASLLGRLENGWKDPVTRLALLDLVGALAPRLDGQAAAQLVSKLNILYFQTGEDPLAAAGDSLCYQDVRPAAYNRVDCLTRLSLYGGLKAFVSESSIVSKIPAESAAQFASDLFRYGFSSNQEVSRNAGYLLKEFAPHLSGEAAAQLAATIDAYVRSNAVFHPEDQKALIPFLSASTAAKAADRLRPQILELALRSGYWVSPEEDKLIAFVLLTSKAGTEPMYRTGAVRDLLLIVSLPPVRDLDRVRVAAAGALSGMSGREFDLNDRAAIAIWARKSIGLDPASIRPTPEARAKAEQAEKERLAAAKTKEGGANKLKHW